ncbi:hypothetical protein PSY19_24270, partial [Shigella flexneri]|nr:hypothetical protein [Shigella flexneri]
MGLYCFTCFLRARKVCRRRGRRKRRRRRGSVRRRRRLPYAMSSAKKFKCLKIKIKKQMGKEHHGYL